MIKFDINTNGIAWYTNQLEKLHQSALPNSVRGTLNGMAFDVKQKTMPLQVQKDFTNRNKTFFKANSRVEKARGFDVNSMQSIVGFKAHSNTKNNKAVDELEKQEFGGVIKNRELIPLDKARTSNSKGKNVRKANRLSMTPKNIKNNPRVFDVSKNKSKSKKQKYIRTILAAKKSRYSEVYILGNKHSGGKQTLSRIDSFHSNLSTRKLVIKRTPLYSFKKGRVAKIKPTNFMKRASYESGLKVEKIYIKEAQRQFERYYNS